MPVSLRVSLANKCQLLFGGAIVLILVAALAIGMARMHTLVSEGQRDAARMLADAWLAGLTNLPDRSQRTTAAGLGASDAPATDEPDAGNLSDEPSLVVELIRREDFESQQDRSWFVSDAVALFEARDDLNEHFAEAEDDGGNRVYLYARAIRKSDLVRMWARFSQMSGMVPLAGIDPKLTAGVDVSPLADPLRQVIVISFSSAPAERQLMLNRIYVVAAGLAAGLLAIGAFWYITTRIILSPVRVLRDTAERIAAGDTNIRSDISTGDEFEQLSNVFNSMLAKLKTNEEELRRHNKTLDLRLGELAESNVSLYEANKVKGEFLANVSHELRTPLNSIMGFAEVLEEGLKRSDNPIDEKRCRYAFNIIASSRRLLDLINDLLDLAKIEAGRMDVRLDSLVVGDMCEGLVALVRPLAEKAGLDLSMQIRGAIPVVQTDGGKVQQILFNFLSNAIKFTPHGGSVSLRVELADAPPGSGAAPAKWVRISVADTGPGIPADQQERIFEKFTQLDNSATRHHGGSGLGLTISRDLARLLQGRIELDSEVGRGATFSLLLPLVYVPKRAPLMPTEVSGK